jgi:predicted transcriptional regulator
MPKVWVGTTIEMKDEKRLKDLCKQMDLSKFGLVRKAVLEFLKVNETHG